jgi:hypothetical protein
LGYFLIGLKRKKEIEGQETALPVSSCCVLLDIVIISMGNCNDTNGGNMRKRNKLYFPPAL